MYNRCVCIHTCTYYYYDTNRILDYVSALVLVCSRILVVALRSTYNPANISNVAGLACKLQHATTL